MDYYKGTAFQPTGFRGAEDFYLIPYHRIAQSFVNLVEKEKGPIHIETAQRRLAMALNVRLGSRIVEKMNQSISFAHKQKALRVDGIFLWPKGMYDPPLRIHEEGQPSRDIETIHPIELEKLLAVCVENAISIEREDLVKEAARLLGIRATAKVKSVLFAIIRRSDKLHEANGRVSLSSAAK